MSSFCKCKSYSHFFSKNISIYAIFNDQSFNNTLTNDIVSFEQLGPGDHNARQDPPNTTVRQQTGQNMKQSKKPQRPHKKKQTTPEPQPQNAKWGQEGVPIFILGSNVVKTCGITVLEIFIWGGISSVLRLKIGIRP